MSNETTKTVMFSKYPSIELSEKEFIIDKIRKHGYALRPYVITEKIHGANTQICYNCITDEFEYGKRTGILEPDEKFYGVHDCFENIKENIIDLATYLKPTLTKKLEVVKVFGEIFGGAYPHPDVQRDTHATKVQKGVYYSPSNHWLAFDIAYKLEGDPTTYFLGAEDFFLACGACAIGTVPLLAVVNTLDEALEYPNDKPSVVYQIYDLPELEDNIMEGVVIRPAKADLYMGMTRVILKNKNMKFKEKSHVKRPNLTQEYSDNLNQVLAELTSYITENRVENVISHEGEVVESDIGKIIGLTIKDIMEEYVKESKIFNLLEKVETKIVSKRLPGMVAPVVKTAIYRRLRETC